MAAPTRAQMVKGLAAAKAQGKQSPPFGSAAWRAAHPRQKGTSKRKPGKKPPLGTGQRFQNLQGQLANRGAKDPAALAAYIGRKKYGKAKFSKLGNKNA